MTEYTQQAVSLFPMTVGGILSMGIITLAAIILDFVLLGVLAYFVAVGPQKSAPVATDEVI